MMAGEIFASGRTKDEIIVNLLAAIKELERDPKELCSARADDWEYDIYLAGT